MKKAIFSLSLVLLLVLVARSVPPEKSKTAEKVKPAATTSTAVVDDATITKNVKEKFAASSSLKEVPINVETKNGVVRLTGQVKNPGTKGGATRMAKAVPGVKEVNNQMTVAEGTASMKPKESKTK
jgi:hyperosmotically inducible protein